MVRQMVSGGSHGDIIPRLKVLITEKISPDGLALLQSVAELHERSGLSPEELLSIIPEYDALIVRSETKVTASVLEAAKRLKVVARAGVGVDNVDVATATKHGIIIVNSPAGNITSAAEHTIALMMATARNIGDACASIKSGKWERSRLVGVEVKGKTLGIIGLGKVGLTVARIAVGLGMTVTAFDPYANPSVAAAASVELVTTLAGVLVAADFLTLHTPLIASTKGIIGAEELASMKPTARILNVARGGLIDEAALLDALNTGKIAGAGMDVFKSEPPIFNDPAFRLIAHPKVVATPHLGASTVEASRNVSKDVSEQILQVLAGQLPRSGINTPIILDDEYRQLQPFVSLVERMGSIYTQRYGRQARTTADNGNAFRTTFDLTYEGSLATINNTKPLFAALVKGLLATISSELNINIVNAELIAKQRGILINEQRSRELPEEGYSSYVTLRARVSRSASVTGAGRRNTSPESEQKAKDQVIAGFVSNNKPYISRLNRFVTNFEPTGIIVVCRNFDMPGKIGIVGNLLGRAGVNINFMSVAPLSQDHDTQAASNVTEEALMILGVDKPVEENVLQELVREDGVLDANVILL